MKKIYVLLFLVLTIFGLASCKKDVSLETVLDSVEITYSGDDSASSVTSHLTLPKSSSLNKDVKFNWVSDNPQVIDHFGTVNRPEANTEVTITLTISLNDKSESRDYVFTVIGLNSDLSVIFIVSNQTYQTVKVKFGGRVDFFSDPTLEGYTFDGWYIAPEKTDAYDFSMIITESMTIEAKFTAQSSNPLDDFDFTGFNNYYAVLNASSDVITDLARRLRNTIRYVSYGDARYIYTKYDNDSQVVLYDVPSSTSYRKVPAYGTAGWGSGGNISGSGFSVTLNREHVWACSDMRIMPSTKSSSLSSYVAFNINDGSFDYRPDNSSKGHYTDLHNLWNSLAGPNGTHSDHFYGEENGKSVSPYLKNNAFYPGDEYRGDIARILFYMTLMYPHLTLVKKGDSNANEGSIYYGYLDVLMRWNEEDPVSYYEIERNQTIFNAQGNRNPFVDYYNQDFAELLFANGDPNVLN